MKKNAAFSILIVLCLLLSLWYAPGARPASAQAEGPLPPISDMDGTPDPNAPIPEPIPFDYQGPPGLLLAPDTGSLTAVDNCTPDAGQWQVKSPLGVDVYGPAVASDGQYIYAAGGYSISLGGPLNNFQRYDPVTNTWQSLTPLPAAVSNALAVFAEGKIYVLGGLLITNSTTDLVQVYTIAADSWSTAEHLPEPRQQMGGGYYNGHIYAVGGYADLATASADKQTWDYTIISDTWASQADMPTEMGGMGTSMWREYLMVLGGRNPAGTTLNSAYYYYIPTNTWGSLPNLPVAVNTPGAVTYMDQIWVFGGGTPFLNDGTAGVESIESVNTTQIFDIYSGAWRSGPAQNSARSFQGSGVVRNQIVSVGGYSGSSSSVVEVSTQQPLKILILYADNVYRPMRLRAHLLSQPGVGQVDMFDARIGTPPDELYGYYDVIVPFSNSPLQDGTTIGNVLSAYQNAGGVVVALDFSWNPFPYAISGDWLTFNSPFNTTSTFLFTDTSLGTYATGHPLMAGVENVNVFHHMQLTTTSGASVIAYWDDGSIMAAAKGNAVGINAYVGDYNGVWSGDLARMIVNAGYWLGRTEIFCAYLTCSNPIIFNNELTASDTVSSGRIFRNTPGSTCAAPQACEVNDAIAYHYDAYPFLNNSGVTQCVTVKLDPQSCIISTSLHSSAYLSYNPANICNNFLGDIGASPGKPASYSFTVPAWQAYTVIVNEANPNAYCAGYTLQVSAGDCPVKINYLPGILR